MAGKHHLLVFTIAVSLAALGCGGSAGEPNLASGAAQGASAAQSATMTVEPRLVEVAPSAPVSFAANVYGTARSGVTWQVEEAGGGTIDASGHYVAPSTAGTFHVIARSDADDSVVAVATVQVVADPPSTDSSTPPVTATPPPVTTTPPPPVTATPPPVTTTPPPVTTPPPPETTTPPPVTTGPTYYVAHNGNDANAGTIGAPWRTLSVALSRVRPGDTLYIRGSASGDTNTACASDGAQGGACWTESEPCASGSSWRCSPLHWSSDGRSAGTAQSPLKIAAYPGETVIIEPAGSSSDAHVVYMSPAPDYGNCSWIVLEGLILDNRNCSGGDCTTFRVDYASSGQSQSTMCRNGTVNGVSIRHGFETGGARLFTYRWTYNDIDVYENGLHADGDHDHGLYVKGGYNVFNGGRVHHNLQGIQIWDTPGTEAGHHEFHGMEVDHNGRNPFNGATRLPGNFGDLATYLEAGSYTTIDGCSVHDNTMYGISLSASWGDASSNNLVTNNHIWNNGNDTVYAGGSTGNVISGNVTAAP